MNSATSQYPNQYLAMLRSSLEGLGRRAVNVISETGYAVSLFIESIYWLIVGKSRSQSVRLSAIFREAMYIGVNAVPVSSLLVFAVGVMLAIQGIETLKTFGAEATVVIGIALSITKEFSPLIVGILVAGRSGSAITARIGSMVESQEIDALRVIGINPVRYLAAPVLLAMMIMMPVLTIIGDFAGLLGGAVYTLFELQISLPAYFERSMAALVVDDIRQGLIKAFIFSIIIALTGLSNGFNVRGGAEGVGRATTRSVVMSISLIIVADMIFTFLLNR